MNAAEELEEVSTLNRARNLIRLDSVAETGSSTQQLLDDLLGRLDDDDSLMSLR